MLLSKPSDFFNNDENSLVSEEDVNDSFNQYKLNSDKLDYFVSKIDVLSEKLSTKIDKSDLENAIFSQLITLEDKIKKLKSSYEGMGKLKNDMIREEFNDKLNDIAEAIDNNIQILNDKFEQSSIRLRRDVAVYNNLTKIIEGKVDKLDRDDEKISLIEKTTVDLDKKILDVDLKSDIVGEEIGVVRGEIDTKINDVVESIDDKFKRTARNIKYVEESTDKLDRKISNTKIELELEIDDKIDNLSKTVDSVSESLDKINRDDDRVDNLNSNISSIEESIDGLQRKVSSAKVELELKNDNLSRDIDSISERVDIKVEQIDTKIENITQIVEDKSKSDSEEIDIVKEENIKFKRSVSDNLVEYKIKTDDNLKEITNSIDLFIEELKKETDRIDNRVNQIVDESLKFDNKIKNVVEENNNSIEEYASKLRNEITNVKVDVVINEKTIKKIDGFLNENHQELIDLKEEVFSQIKNLPLENLENNISKLESKIDYIRETYSKINTEDTVKEVIKEGLLNEPPNKNNGDPLSKNDFVTLPQLQEHYRLFINRIQQQLSTLGGGGEVRLEFLDDVDRNSAKVNGKFLKYDSSVGKWVGANASGGAGSQTLDETLGLGNTSSLGMSVGVLTATSFSGDGSNLTGISTFSGNYNDLTNTPTIPTNNNQLTNGAGYITTSFTNTNQLTNGAGYITTSFTNTNQLTNGAGFITSSDDITGTSGGLTGSPSIIVTDITAVGNVSIAGTLTYEDVTNVDSIGIATARTGLNVLSGGINVTGVSTFQGNVNLGDNDKLQFGDGIDLQIYSDGSTSYIEETNASSALLIKSNSTEIRSGGNQPIAKFIDNAGVELYYPSGDKKFETTGYGVTVFGTTESQQLNVTGVSTFTNKAEVRSDDGSQGRIDFYCEVSNAHYTRIQAAAHADYSGNAVVTLPSSTGTLLLTDGDGSNLTGISTFSGNYNDLTNTPTIPTNNNQLTNGAGYITTSFTSTSQLTNDAGFITNNVSGVLTATSFSGDGSNLTSINVDLSQTQIFTGGIAEKFQTGTTLAADNTLALSDGNVIRRTSNESGNQTVNFTGVHSTLSSGQVVSFTVIITPNGSGVIDAVQIDGQAITVSWSGGSAPSAGSSGKDVYTFSVFKTGTGVSDYEVYGAATNYA